MVKSEAEKIRDAQIAWKKYSLSQRGIAAAVRIAQSDPRMRISINALDANPYDLNTYSGIVDLTTGKIRPNDPKAYCTKITGIGCDRHADGPKWKAFLTTTFQGDDQDELIAYMQRLLGYAAIGKVTHNILPFCYGDGDNGKSVLLNVVMKSAWHLRDCRTRQLRAGRKARAHNRNRTAERGAIRAVLRSQRGQPI
jgi:phage/plasmid-associated DNA primase